MLKAIDAFPCTDQTSVRLTMLGSALAADFGTEGRSLIFCGTPGRGTTPLAIALAYRAIQHGCDTYVTTAATLIEDRSKALRGGPLAQALPEHTPPAVRILDEGGSLTYGTDPANLLVHVVHERPRRRRSMIVTTHTLPKTWGRVLHDEDLAQAIVDRLLERRWLITRDGPPMRTRHRQLDEVINAGSDQDDEVSSISGIQCQNLRNPQPCRQTVSRASIHRPPTYRSGDPGMDSSVRQSSGGFAFDFATPGRSQAASIACASAIRD